MLGVITSAEAQAHAPWPSCLASLAADRRATRLSWVEGARHVDLWVAAERLSAARQLYPSATMHPDIEVPKGYEAAASTPGDALRDLLRSRLGGLGPVNVDDLVEQLGLPRSDIEIALTALQIEGSVFNSLISPGAETAEWCERHLLARIHRYTLKRLRREIEPVEPRDFCRFLFQWQRVAPSSCVSGPEALPAVLAQLEAFEAPAALWETELLPARVRDYTASWLDDLCTSGRTVWTRLRPVASSNPGGSPSSLRATPIVLLPRRTASTWARLDTALTAQAELSNKAGRVADYLAAHGASFFDEIAAGCRLLGTELENALAELVACGRINSDRLCGPACAARPAIETWRASRPVTPAPGTLQHRRRRALDLDSTGAP